MSQAAAAKLLEDASDLESIVETIIANCDGDPRAAIRTLVVANSFLEQDLERLRASVSAGYVRGRHHRLVSHADSMASGHSGER